MGREFKFKMNISQYHLASSKKCVRANENKYVELIIALIVGEKIKYNRQTIVIVPKRLTKMPTLSMWDNPK